MNKKDLIAKRLLLEDRKTKIRMSLKVILLLFSIVFPIAWFSIPFVNTNLAGWQIVLGIAIFIVAYLALYKVNEKIERKRVDDLISFEKEMGFVYLFNGWVYHDDKDIIKTISPIKEKIDVTKEGGYYLKFNPFLNDTLEVRFEISKDLYDEYREKINDIHTSSKKKSFSDDSLVIIETTTGLVDAKRFARRDSYNIHEKFIY